MANSSWSPFASSAVQRTDAYPFCEKPCGTGSKCAESEDCPSAEIDVMEKTPLAEEADGGGGGIRICAGVCGPGPAIGNEIPWTRTPGSCTAIAVTSGEIFLGK